MKHFGPVEVYTDRLDDERLAGARRRDVRELPDDRTVPRSLLSESPVACLATSGSTGYAKIVLKTFGRLIGEMHSLNSLFRPGDERVQIITTLPFEHMYGYVYGCFWPLFSGLSVPEERITLPAQLRQELSRGTGPVWLVTTPLHLSVFSEAAVRTDRVTRVFSATSVLANETAAKAYECFGTAVTDIYGSTETGTIGWRPCKGEPSSWQCIPGRGLREVAEGRFQLECADFDEPEPISDVLEFISAERFNVLGRAADLVKVAGKRTSLSALNGALLEVPGVRDGAYWMPEHQDEGSNLTRPVAFVVMRDGVRSEEVLAHLRTRVDPVFLPRPLFVVPSMNRNSVGKLPLETLRSLYAACSSEVSA